MNKSNNQKLGDEIKRKMTGSLLNTLLDSNNLRQAKSMIDLIVKCKESSVGPDRIIDSIDDNIDQINNGVDLAKAASQGQDEFFSTIASKVTNRIMKDVSPLIFDLTINQIKMKTEGEERGAQVSIPLFSTTISPYIQFSLILGPGPTARTKLLRINFQIKTTGEISDLGIMVSKHEKKISAKLHYTVEGSITKFETAAGTISTNIELAKKEFEADLVNFNIN